MFIVARCRVFRSIATIAAVDHVRQKEECDQLGGLVKQQRQICKRNVDMMDAVKAGAVHSIDECQYQFRYRRWNCSTVNTATVFGRIVKAGQSLSRCFVVTASIVIRVLQVGGGNLPPDPVFSPLHQNCLDFLERFRDFS